MFNPQLLTMLQQFKSNPLQMLTQKYNIPQGMNDPDAILKHLLSSGQVTQQQVDAVQNMKNLFK